NAVDLGVCWGLDGRDDLDGLEGCLDRLDRWCPVGFPGQELRHLALDLAENRAKAAGWVDLLPEFTAEVGELG
ncbi:hypothetical protein ACIO6T_45340, partial [Streptomyces sp. NPDC087532]|uniref:hypothetical protein n=1 Tax=Streptomyces sp. NPDC087532 TaxID=3365795 RepID=UPI0037FE7CA5